MYHYVTNVQTHWTTLRVAFGTELRSSSFYEKSPEICIKHSCILYIKSESNPNTDSTLTKCVSSESFEVYHLVITVALVHCIHTIFSQRIGAWAAYHALNQNTSWHWRSRELFVWSVHTINIPQIFSVLMEKFSDPTKHGLMCLEIGKINTSGHNQQIYLTLYSFCSFFYFKDTVKTSFLESGGPKDWLGWSAQCKVHPFYPSHCLNRRFPSWQMTWRWIQVFQLFMHAVDVGRCSST